MGDIDRIDLTLLMALDEAGRPLWKKSVHRCLQELSGIPAELSEISVQTVGRRVDALHEGGYLAPNIVTPEDINRDLIIAYEPTADGREALAQKREEILREHVSTPKPVHAPAESESAYVARLFADELGLGGEGRAMLASYTDAELAALIASYYLQRDLDDALAEHHLENLAEIGDTDERLASVVETIADFTRR